MGSFLNTNNTSLGYWTVNDARNWLFFRLLLLFRTNPCTANNSFQCLRIAPKKKQNIVISLHLANNFSSDIFLHNAVFGVQQHWTPFFQNKRLLLSRFRILNQLGLVFKLLLNTFANNLPGLNVIWWEKSRYNPNPENRSSSQSILCMRWCWNFAISTQKKPFTLFIYHDTAEKRFLLLV